MAGELTSADHRRQRGAYLERRLRAVLDEAEPGLAGRGHEIDQLWAKPDLETAARGMRELAEPPARARDLGDTGRKMVRASLPDGYHVAHWRPWLAADSHR